MNILNLLIVSFDEKITVQYKSSTFRVLCQKEIKISDQQAVNEASVTELTPNED